MKRTHRSILAFASAAALSLGTAPAVAQDTARGEQLYREGVEAYARGDLASACPRFEQSLQADRQAAPLFMWAKCAHKEGKLVSALERYEEVLRLGGLDDKLRDEAARAVTDLGPRVPKLQLQRGAVSDQATVRVDGAVVSVGGKTLALDPGSHRIRVEQAGHEPFEAEVELTEASTTTFELRLGAPLAPSSGAGASTGGEVGEPSRGPSGLLVGGFVAGGVGAAGLVLAGVTGGMILGACDGDLACPTRTDDDPGTGLLVANGVGFGLGLAGAATSAVLFILAATSDEGAEAAAALPLVPAPDGSLGLGLRLRF